jgi:hypothetical protein
MFTLISIPVPPELLTAFKTLLVIPSLGVLLTKSR